MNYNPPALLFSMESTVSIYEDVVPKSLRVLSDEHRKVLEEGSAISPDVIEQRGYYTLAMRDIIRLVQAEIINPLAQKGSSWMGIPILRPDSVKHGEIIRVWDSPLKQKYVWPTGARTAIDLHPMSFESLDAREHPIFITEGIKKADAILSAARREDIPCLVLALNGNYGWRSVVEGSKVVCPDFLDIPLTDRRVFIIPDSDYRSNDQVARGWDELANYLAAKTGDHRTFVAVVPPAGLEKQGADDYFVGGGTLAVLLGLAQSPKQATGTRESEPRPLLVRSATRLIEESGVRIPHLIEPLLPEQSIMLLAGHSGTLKTWHALSIVVDLAMGKRWLDHPDLGVMDKPVSCLYVNKEMSGIILGQRLRLLAKNERYSADPVALQDALDNRVFTVDEAILDLTSEVQRDRLEEAIVSNSVKVVVLDSLSMCWSGDENSNSEVGVLYGYLRGIIERTGVCFIIIHHLDKPQGNGKNRNNILFSIRGAGQLGQQADVALVMSRFDPAKAEPNTKQISIVHAKARTAQEIPSFISQFSENDGISISMAYHSQLAGAQEKSYVASGKDPKFLDGWIVEALRANGPMMPSTGIGLRLAELTTILLASWSSKEPPPRDGEIKKRLDALVSQGIMEITEKNSGRGNNYRFKDVNLPVEVTEIVDESADDAQI